MAEFLMVVCLVSAGCPTILPAAEHLCEGGGRPALFVVVADDAFPLWHNLMKPYPQKKSG